MPAKMVKTRTPGIYKRGNTYVFSYRTGGKQRWESCRTLDDARRLKAQRKADVDRGEFREQPTLAFREYAEEWISTYRGRTDQGCAEATRAAYARILETRVVPFFADRKLADIGRRDVKALVRHLETAGLKPASVVKAMAPVKAMFADALDDEVLRADPAARVRVTGNTASGDEPAKAMTRAQLARFMAAVDPGWRLFFDVLAETGVRVSEAIGLDCGDLQDGRLHVERQCYRGTVKKLKTRNARRTLPLTASLAERLWDLSADRPSDAPMFVTSTGSRLSDGNVRRRILAPAALLAEVEWIGFHSFRHSCASILFDNGRNIAQVSKWLGHADPAFTLRTYVHLMDAGLGGPNEPERESANSLRTDPTPTDTPVLALAGTDTEPTAPHRARG